MKSEDLVLRLVDKGRWAEGKYPTHRGIKYRTRMMKFVDDSGQSYHINLKDYDCDCGEFPAAFLALNIGDRISDMRLHAMPKACAPGLIHPRSSFKKIAGGALF